MQTAYITHSLCLKHDVGGHHPECPARIRAIEDQLIASGLINYLSHYDAEEANLEDLQRAHSDDHIAKIRDNIPEAGVFEIDGDTSLNPFSWKAALRASGAVIQAIDLVLKREVSNAFCCIRPPGHHAERNGASGFCLFNNVAVGALYAVEKCGVPKVAVVDFDVHHGNGTEDILKDNPNVLFMSTFQHPFYPYCGADSTSPNVVNVPMKAGTTGKDFRDAVEKHWLPALHEFKPDLLLISAGFDAHWEDDMGSFKLLEKDYQWVTEQLMAIGDTYCGGKVVSVLEGGYELHALGRSVLTHLKVLSDL